ncbi:MAG: LysE family translocator [Bacteroidetes bacterium]|nr:LysE family translocator [Bacteroidota bacterium]
MILQGMLLGLTLSFMIGPILLAIVQAGIDKGFRAGMAVASGIWTCDVLYILLVRFGLETLSALTAWPGFRFWAGFIGGMVLLVFGVMGFRKKVIKPIDAENTLADRLLDQIDGHEPPNVKHNWQQLGLPGYWLRGFLLNLINPGTLFFWIGIATAVVAPNNWNGAEISRFFGGMMATLVILDTLKAYGAKQLRNWLTIKHIQMVQKSIALLMLVFGGALILRALSA